jgi:hypothetical protein
MNFVKVALNRGEMKFKTENGHLMFDIGELGVIY